MSRHALKIALGLGTLAMAIGLALVWLAPGEGGASPWGATVALAVAMGLYGYVLARAATFGLRLDRFVRHLLAGQYESGIKPGGMRADEIANLERLLNRFADQLRAYDRLRADGVRMAQRSLDTVLQAAERPIALVEMAPGTLRCNPPLRALLGIEPQTLSLRAMEKIDGNEPFVEMLRRTTQTEKVAQKGDVTVHLPARDLRKRLSVQLVPIKDREGAVPCVVLLAGEPAAAPAEPNTQKA